MKKVHLYGPSICHTYTTVCGLQISDTYLDTTNRKKVTCKRCLRTMRKRKMPKQFLIHKTFVDIEAKPLVPLKEYYTQNPIPEGAEFEVQYEGQTLWFRMGMHYVTNEVVSVVELVGVGEPCAVKRPRLSAVVGEGW